MATYTETIVADSAAGGTLINRNMNFDTAVAGGGAMEVRQDLNWYWSGQTFAAGVGYEIFGFLMVFDTSVIPVNGDVIDVQLQIRINRVTITPSTAGDTLVAWFRLSNWTEPLGASDWQTWNASSSAYDVTYGFTWSGDWDTWLTLTFPYSTYGTVNKGAGARTGVISGYSVPDIVFGYRDYPNYMRFAHEQATYGVEARLVVTYEIIEADATQLIVDMRPEGFLNLEPDVVTTTPVTITVAMLPEGILNADNFAWSTLVNLEADMFFEGLLGVTAAGITNVGVDVIAHGYLQASPGPSGPAPTDVSGTLNCCCSGLLFLDSGETILYIPAALGGVGTLSLTEFNFIDPLWDGELVLSGVGTLSINLKVAGYETISASMLLEVEGSGNFPP